MHKQGQERRQPEVVVRVGARRQVVESGRLGIGPLAACKVRVNTKPSSVNTSQDPPDPQRVRLTC